MTLADLLPDSDYGFSLRFERGDAADFFRAGPNANAILKERLRWLTTAPSGCLALLPEGVPLLNETIELARAWNTLTEDNKIPRGKLQDDRQQAFDLGAAWEPDFILLRPNDEGEFRLVAGCVCFPSSWSLEEKVGRPIQEIHGIVPGLNDAIGPQIHRFLAKLRPGTAWLRGNWGLSRSPELNQHPSRKLPRLDDKVSAEEVWVRVELQALVALPKTRGVLFGIRILVQPLAEICADPALAARLVRALRTMRGPMAEYKGLGTARLRLISLIAESP